MNSYRDISLDNGKGILIFLVVLGHVMGGVNQEILHSSFLRFINPVIYSFHMPAFVLISGYLTSDVQTRDKKDRNILANLAIPYLVFNLTYILLSKKSITTIFEPQMGMWYLMSLALWRLYINVHNKLQYPLLIAVIFSLFCGLTEAGTFFSISRSVSFFPYFVMGYNYKTLIMKVKEWNKVVLTLIFVGCCLASLIANILGMPEHVLNMHCSYEALGLSLWTGVLFRLFALVLGFIMSISLWCLLPNKETIFTHMGKNSMLIYLLHLFPIRLVRHFYDFQNIQPLLILLICVVSSIGLCVIFGNELCSQIYSKVLDRIESAIIK